MADNLPNAVDPVPEFNVITQDYVLDDAVVAEVVAEATKKFSRVVTRGLKKTVTFSEVSHGASFDVTGNDDPIEDLSTDDNEFITVSPKKRRVTSSGISASDKKVISQKIENLIKKNEKTCAAKDDLHISLRQAKKKVRTLETSLKTAKKKVMKSEATISSLKIEESRLLLLNRSLKKTCDKHQK